MLPGAAATVAEAVWRRWNCLGEAGVNLVTASFYCEGFSIHECIGDLFMGGFDNSTESLSRDVHFLGGLFLV